ncbi:hypothetical protein A2422_00635 [Candidatus Woesebacteria bacterium RIFOXYC1_FULL_31_51]|uniref:SH3 type 3 domain protein n=1 Tax=Candidatus Woesebacteria bacterium GW2011_GWC2_31_9 TaxID=1618586 RepID=A0A0F9YLY4_9BACT|nr:MAG: SH3 type 3 domain-containing protein, poly-gamma-glutamate synthesis protein (capsule biosynthesis protein) [Candidatus Woesebacteria bacterium GW2011_GWF1_31_35]KKP22825.1 MAG: SH3 type 3 domain protein [Candidatus Woesebacteria bacterium GW2011_GWC1_30_29]KKP26687.1 MAG: SH3 type 3 domain protein [Candidatus Woesebacteria bacterium GW2011_GWD1_31_12]KKP28073.1 MAG: SH3 type 3 domain protein [Candidatus Woesebacteria bacterium GW2011_GWB1_31_29]KKP31402.1 MAG: SH3 type 3 domain protein
MLDKLISSIFVFLLSLVPTFPNQPLNELKNNQTTIIFVGDIMLGRSVMGKAIEVGDNYYPFRKTSEVLNNADITFANLENPIVKNCPGTIGGFKFCTNYEIANGLTFAGIDIVSLANNHSGNYGLEGLTETKKFLSDNNISYVGDSNLAIKEVNGTKFGFLGFDYTLKNNLDNDLKLIKDSKGKVDVLIIGVHWGDEYKDEANSLQRTIAKKMIEAGVDVIIGGHPHWIEDYEEINGKSVYYSLGNFIFDQMWSEETKKGLVVKLTFDRTNLVKKEEFNTYIKSIGQPEIVD